jgi:hypothetical protein
METIAPQRDLRFLTIGNLWLVVATCGQKMWRKMCVMATRYSTGTGGVGVSWAGSGPRASDDPCMADVLRPNNLWVREPAAVAAHGHLVEVLELGDHLLVLVRCVLLLSKDRTGIEAER